MYVCVLAKVYARNHMIQMSTQGFNKHSVLHATGFTEGQSFFFLFLGPNERLLFEPPLISSALFNHSPICSKLILFCIYCQALFLSSKPAPYNTVIVNAHIKAIVNAVATLSYLELQILFLSGEEHSFKSTVLFPVV